MVGSVGPGCPRGELTYFRRMKQRWESPPKKPWESDIKKKSRKQNSTKIKKLKKIKKTIVWFINYFL